MFHADDRMKTTPRSPGRRAVLAAACGALCASLDRARAQNLPQIGALGSASAESTRRTYAALRASLAGAGFVEGSSVAIAYRWADNRYERLPALAVELARLPVDVIVTTGGLVSALAAQAATTTIPIVFSSATDPVDNGLVASLNRPGGNLTGIATLTVELDAKRLELLHELVPARDLVGVLANGRHPRTGVQVRGIRQAAERLGMRIVLHVVDSDADLDAAFATLAGQGIGALLVAADPLFSSSSAQVARLAARYAIPTMYHWREFVDDGGLISYGTHLFDALRLAALYVARILRGERPGDLPVEQSARVELVVNAGAARALGLAIPASILARADEVIE
jgi:putative ABC transport system substrate-binding protein